MAAKDLPGCFQVEVLECRRLLSFGVTFAPGAELQSREDENVSPDPPGNAGNEAESLIVMNPTNPLNVVAFSVDRDSSGSVVTVEKAWYSLDGGLSYDNANMAYPQGHVGVGDPAASFDRAGHLYYCHITLDQSTLLNHVSIAKSVTGGATWASARIVASSAPGGSSVDRAWVVTGHNPADPNVDIVHVVYVVGGTSFSARSINGGDSFSSPIAIPGSGRLPHVATDIDGNLFGVYLKEVPGDDEIRLNYSTNQGGSWQQSDQLVGTSSIVRVTGNLPAQPWQGIYPVPSVAAWKSPAGPTRVFVSFATAINNMPDTDITVAVSDDPTGSQGWAAQIIHSTSGSIAGKSQSFSWVSVDRMSGVPYVSWLDCRNSSTNTKVERFVTASTDGGDNWLPEVRVADDQSDQSSSFPYLFNYGDYIANSAFGAMSYDAWPDNSNSTDDNVDGTDALDIYTDRTILNGHVITFTGTSGDDTYDVQMDSSGEFVKIWENTSTSNPPTFMMHKNALSGLEFDLDDGVDVVLVTPGVLTYLDAAGVFLDLGDSHMILDYSGTSPQPTVQALLTSGYNGGAWNGQGIRSSAAASETNTGLGFLESSEKFTSFPATFAGQAVDNTAVLIKYTFYGDTDLTGGVGLADFNRLAANLGIPARRWFHGDFNFDTVVNLTDFNMLAENFGEGDGEGFGPGGGEDETFGYTVEDLLDHLLHGGHGITP